MDAFDPPYTFPSGIDYPIALAIWHFHNGRDTPVSGDDKHFNHEERTARRVKARKHYLSLSV